MIKQTIRNILQDRSQKPARHLRQFYHYLKTKTFGLKSLGKNSVIISPIQLSCPLRIEVGNDVFIWDNARINVIEQYYDFHYEPELILEDGVTIGQNCHIVCCNSIVLKKGATLGPCVTLADAHHGYEDLKIPIMRQQMKSSPIVIGENSLINSHCFVSQGVKIGKECFIGAGSVVVNDIPDYSVAVGNPARVIRQRGK